MQTIILCGGIGARLREETEYRPKPMVEIGSRPILWHIMKGFARYGHTEFVLPLGYKGNIIKEYFHNYEFMNADMTIELGKPNGADLHQSHDEEGWKITLADTGERTLKGGRIKRVQKYIHDDIFMLTYGDGVANVDIDALVAFHKSHGKMVTVTGVNPLARFGELKVQGDMVTSFLEKAGAEDKGLISGGFFVCNKAIFDYLTEAEDCDLEYGPLERLVDDGQLMVYRHTGFWSCMDTLRDVEALNNMWEEGKAPWKTW